MGSTERRPPTHSEGAPTSDFDASAVLYVCAERSKEVPGLSTERAVNEGRSLAETHRLQIREIADAGDIATVVTRWPNCASPEHELRYPEVAWLKERGVRVLFSWAPLSVLGTEL